MEYLGTYQTILNALQEQLAERLKAAEFSLTGDDVDPIISLRFIEGQINGLNLAIEITKALAKKNS